MDKGDYLPPRGEEVSKTLKADEDITHVVAVHCETSSGILNPIEEISDATYKAGRKLLVDSMSAFGAIPIEPKKYCFEAFFGWEFMHFKCTIFRPQNMLV